MAFTEPIISKLVDARQIFFNKSYTEIHDHSAHVLAGDKSQEGEQKNRGANVFCV